MKNIFLAIFIVLGTTAQADQWATTPNSGLYPYSYHPYHNPYPTPYNPSYQYGYGYGYGVGSLTCYAQGMYNGAIFYGVSFNISYASQLALNACYFSGQYCQLIGCQPNYR